jgi:16S rRNA (cytidine1402-2'-O)-methyltransferase
LLASCRDSTRLCIAADLTLPGETVTTKPIAEWRRAKTPIGRRPAVFLLLAQAR